MSHRRFAFAALALSALVRDAEAGTGSAVPAGRIALTIAKREFTIAERYAAGHTLTENEASALNQLLTENVRNNLASKVKELPDFGQAEVDQYADSYQFGQRRAAGTGTGRVSDPVEKEAIALVSERIRDALRAKGSTAAPADVKAKALEILGTDKGEAFRELARKRIEEARAAAESLGDLDVSAIPEKPAATETTGEGEGAAAPKSKGGRKPKADATA